MRIADVSPDVIGLTEVKPKNPRYLLQPAEIVIGRFFDISDKSCKILFSEFYQIMPCIMFSDN